VQLVIYLILYPIIWLTSFMPFSFLYRLSDLLYVLMYKIIGYRKKVVRKNLLLVFPEKSTKERLDIEKEFYRHFADLFVEMIKAFHMSLAEMQKRFIFKNAEDLNELTGKGKNIVIVGGHYANWEWIFSLAALTDAFPVATYLKINNRYFEKLILKNRQRFGGQLIETKQLRKSLKKFQNNKQKFILGLLADQSPQLHRARYWRSFLGVPDVPVHTGAEELAKKYNASFVFMQIKKIKRGHYEVYFSSIAEETKNIPDFKLTDLFIERLEKQIKEKPAYYLWTHRRFKHQGKQPKK